jgi:hypothetical protein
MDMRNPRRQEQGKAAMVQLQRDKSLKMRMSARMAYESRQNVRPLQTADQPPNFKSSGLLPSWLPYLTLTRSDSRNKAELPECRTNPNNPTTGR